MSFSSKIKELQLGMKMSPSERSADGEPDGDEKGAAKAHDGTAAGNHLANARKAHAKGDHAGAKKHALKAVNTLHSLTKQSGLPVAGGTGDLT
jgi:hypothetical protein